MSTEGQAAESVGAAAKAPNLIQRVMMVFFSPTKLGEALRTRSPWFWTLLVIAIVSVIIVVASPEDLLLQTVRAQGRPEGAQLPAASTLRAIGVGTSLVGTFVFAAIVAGILYLIFNVFFGQSEIAYKQHLSAVAHSWWIVMIGNLIQFALQVAKGDALMRLSFGLLLPEEPSSFFGFFLNNITLFGLWAAVALGLTQSGLAGGKVTGGKAVTTLVVLYLVAAALSGVLQSAGS